MAESQTDALLGRLAVHFKLLTQEQLGEVHARLGRLQEPAPIGPIMVEMELISQDQLVALLKAQAQYLENQREKTDQEPSLAAPAVDSTPTQQDRVSKPTVDAANASANGAGIDVAGIDDAGTDGAGTDVAGTDVAGTDGAGTDGTGTDVAGTDGAGTDGTGTDVAGTDGTGTNVASTDGAGPGLGVTEMASSSLLDSILRQAVELGASDVHIHAKTPILMRVNGELKASGEPIEPSKADKVVRSLLVDSQREVLDRLGQIDFAYEIPGVARFRCNAYRQQNGTDVVLRVIPPEPPTLDQLGLPSFLGQLANFNHGLVLITGPSGCGKSSTLAALVNIVNHERTDHILTIEDPIECVHESIRCVVNQREVHRHTESFARALRAALREDPDIIAIGELRDLETISLAITAAETGHLVFGTLHTNDTISTIDRLIGVFEPDEQPQVRTMLSESLRAVVSQRLLPRSDGKGRVPALEILMNNGAVGNLIRAEKTFQLRSVLQTGSAHGMMLMDDSLAQLVKKGIVARDVALRLAAEPSQFPA